MSPLNKDLSDFFGKYFIAVLSVNLYLYSSASIYLRGGSSELSLRGVKSRVPRESNLRSHEPLKKTEIASLRSQ